MIDPDLITSVRRNSSPARPAQLLPSVRQSRPLSDLLQSLAPLTPSDFQPAGGCFNEECVIVNREFGVRSFLRHQRLRSPGSRSIVLLSGSAGADNGGTTRIGPDRVSGHLGG